MAQEHKKRRHSPRKKKEPPRKQIPEGPFVL